MCLKKINVLFVLFILRILLWPKVYSACKHITYFTLKIHFLVQRNHCLHTCIHLWRLWTFNPSLKETGPLNAGLEKYPIQEIQSTWGFRLICNNFQSMVPIIRYTNYESQPLLTRLNFHLNEVNLHLVGPFFSIFGIFFLGFYQYAW